MQLPNIPPKGTADWFPEEYKIRKYIFDTWRKVCQSYGFEEYLGPLVESVDIWKAKSGEDVGGTELTQITNREGVLDGLAIRPEMTPSVTRMVSRIWKETDKPIKWFSIANFYRNEKPQKGRNREFWQLNADIFGESSQNADIEILCLALDLMRAFNAPRGSYIMKLNHRGLIEAFLDDVLGVSNIIQQKNIIRLLDKYEKLSSDEFRSKLLEINNECNPELIDTFMKSQTVEELSRSFIILGGNKSFQEFRKISSTLGELGYNQEIQFSGSLIRGFDYYDGIIFEMFALDTENSRALFGGGRYNGLADIFGVKESIPAIGFAPGDEPMKLFLLSHGLLDAEVSLKSEKYFLPLLAEDLFSDIQKLAQILRLQGKCVHLGLSQKKLQKALKYADKHDFSHIILYGEDEKKAGNFVVKDLRSGEEIRELL